MKKFFLWIYLWFESWMMRLSIALHNTEESILKADPNDLDEKNKQNQKMRHRNPLAQKMLDGQRDEKFVKDYYELLKKADEFVKNSTPEDVEMAANKWGMNVGKTDAEFNNVQKGNKPKKDKWGRRYDHYGFFDPKNKNYGKTLAEVMAFEVDERTTDDDNDYAIEIMYTNKPIEFGYVGNHEIEEREGVDSDSGFVALSELEKVQKKRFPLIIHRENKNIVNKIEQLTEHVHIRKITEEHKIYEFFIPAKYKVFDHEEDSKIFKEIIDFSGFFIKDEYNNSYGYAVDKYYKKTEIIDESVKDERVVLYQVIKFKGKKMENFN